MKLAILAASFLLVLAACVSRAESFEGTEFNPPRQAAPFQLTDQLGQTARLSDFKGKVVLLTFLYTQCPDVCPITTSHLKSAYELLGDDADDIALVAISVDPARDTLEAARAYSDKWDMTDKWSYLVGSEQELLLVWKAYYIDPTLIERVVNGGQSPPGTREGANQERGADALGKSILEQQLIIHSAPVYVIDRDGFMRSLFTLPFEPEALTHDVRLLL